MNENKERLLQRIASLFKLAEHNSNVEEAAAAAAKARELLLKYNLKEADLKNIGGGDRDTVTHEFIFVRKSAHSQDKWKAILWLVVAQGNLCRGALAQEDVLIIGRQANIDAVYSIATRLASIVEAEGKAQTKRAVKAGECSWDWRGLFHAAVWRNNFYIGAVQMLAERYEAMKKRDTQTTAIVVRDMSQENDRYLFSHFETARGIGMSARSNMWARKAGADFARNLPLGHQELED